MSRSGGEIQPGARKYFTNASFPAAPAVSSLPDSYPELFASVTRRVSTSRSKAFSAANQQLLASYMAIGQDISDRQNLEGWGARIQIESRLHERSGQAVTNFSATAPASDSSPAQRSLADPYAFDFLALTDRRDERELEQQLIQHVESCCSSSGRVSPLSARPDWRSRRRVLRRSAVLPPQAALLRGHRAQGDEV